MITVKFTVERQPKQLILIPSMGIDWSDVKDSNSLGIAFAWLPWILYIELAWQKCRK